MYGPGRIGSGMVAIAWLGVAACGQAKAQPFCSGHWDARYEYAGCEPVRCDCRVSVAYAAPAWHECRVACARPVYTTECLPYDVPRVRRVVSVRGVRPLSSWDACRRHHHWRSNRSGFHRPRYLRRADEFFHGRRGQGAGFRLAGLSRHRRTRGFTIDIGRRGSYGTRRPFQRIVGH